MFEWNVSDLKLYHEKVNNATPFNCEDKTSRADKIAFVDSQTDGELSYLLNLAKRLENDRHNLPVDTWGCIKTISLKAWLKKNDTRGIIDSKYRYGDIGGNTCNRNILNINLKSGWDMWEDFVDETFHRRLLKCRDKEAKWFSEHDELTIATKAFESIRFPDCFGFNIGRTSHQSINFRRIK